MPISEKYLKIFRSMQKQYCTSEYGEKGRIDKSIQNVSSCPKGREVFYATMNKEGIDYRKELFEPIETKSMSEDMALRPEDVVAITPKVFARKRKKKIKDLSLEELEYYHSLFHSQFQELGDKACRLHFKIASEMINRGVPHIRRTLCDGIVELIHNFRTYDSSKVSDAVLRNDWKISIAWLKKLRQSGKPFESPQFEGMDLKAQIIAIKKLAKSIREEMIKRGWHPKELTKFPDNVQDIDVPYINNLTDKELEECWKYLHDKWKKDFGDKIVEDYLNVNIFLQIERYKRGLIDVDYVDKDKLDEEARSSWQEYPSPLSGELIEEPSELTLEQILSMFRNIGILPIKGSPFAAYLVGRIVNEGKIDKDHDIDIVLKQEPDPRILIALQHIQPKWLAKKIHVVFDPSGPGIGNSVPIFGYALNPLPKDLNIKGFGPNRKELSELKLFKYIIGLKPKSGFGTNEFFDIDEMWNKWSSKYIDQDIFIQEKVDGHRIQAHVSKDKVELITEDTQRNRAEQFPEIVEELKKIGKDIILDGEFLVYDFDNKEVKGSGRHKRELGNLIPREDNIIIISGTPDEEFRSRIIYTFYDIMYLDGETLTDKTTSERYDYLKKTIPLGSEYLDIVRGEIASNKVQFFKLVEKYRRLNGSEGVVCKALESIYPVKYGAGENRTGEFAKLKNLKAAEFIVLDITSKKERKTGKAIDTFMYTSGFEVPKDKVNEFSKEKIKEYNNKYYQIIGKAYGTSQRAKIGDIITVMPIRIRKYKDKEGKIFYTWMFPFFKEVRTNKTEPDTLTIIERIAKVGTAPLSEELTDEKIILKLDICKYYRDKDICPLMKRHYPETDRYKLAILEEEVLKYPMMCPLAKHFKCRYLKPYYYGTKIIKYDASLSEPILFDGYELDELIDLSKFPRHIKQELQAKYMECPPGEHDFVMQSHILSKEHEILYPKEGSQHMDWRMKVDHYLLGWSGVGGSVQHPITPEEMFERAESKEGPKGVRAEEKARQALMWIDFGKKREFVEIGTGEPRGVMEILTKGKVIFGAQKVYYHEYFLKDNKYFKDWQRVVVRAINVPKLEPETKEKLPRKELMWRMLATLDPMPYTISRAIKKGWKPPKNNKEPFPMPWTKNKFSEQYQKWLDYMKNKELSENIHFCYSQHSFRGPKHVRYMWIRTYYLMLEQDNRTRMFRMDDFAPIDREVTAVDEGLESKKYMSYEGITDPNSRFNPNKELKGEMKILSKGSVNITEDDTGNLALKFSSGLLKGTWKLDQEEKGSDIYTFSSIELSLSPEIKFVYQSHLVDGLIHFDLRYEKDSIIEEFNLFEDIRKQKSPGIKKECLDKSWMDIKKEEHKKVGNIDTLVNPLDEGRMKIIEDSPDFMSFELKGKILKGLFAAKKEGQIWIIGRTQIARTSPVSILPDGSAFFTAVIEGSKE